MMQSKNIVLPLYRCHGYKKLCKVIPAYHALTLENSIHNYTKDYMFKKDIDDIYLEQSYNSNISTMLYNLDQENSPTLIIRIMKQDVDIEALPFMTVKELNPESYAEIKEREEYADYKRKNMASIDDFTCRKCHHDRGFQTIMQMRSCDEPATVFHTCMKCGHRARKEG